MNIHLVHPFEIVTISGNHDGDVLVDDSDVDSDALTVTTYSHTSATNESGGSASSGTGSSGTCLLYTSPSPRDATLSRMPSSA